MPRHKKPRPAETAGRGKCNQRVLPTPSGTSAGEYARTRTGASGTARSITWAVGRPYRNADSASHHRTTGAGIEVGAEPQCVKPHT